MHEAIIDLYLQVKIRSNEEVSGFSFHILQIDNFNEDQFNKERDRLLKFDSLTVLDYIRTSIEILMQMKLEEEKLAAQQNPSSHRKGLKKDTSNAASASMLLDAQNSMPHSLSSTFKSIDLPPKEYETQL